MKSKHQYNKAPIINENLTSLNMVSGELKRHIDNKKPLIESDLPRTSREWALLIEEVRALYARGIIDVFGKDKLLLEGDNYNWPNEVLSRYEDIIFKLNKVMSDRAKYDLIDKKTGKIWEPGGRVYKNEKQLRQDANNTIMPQGGLQSTDFGDIGPYLQEKTGPYKVGDKITYLGYPGEITAVEDRYGKTYLSVSYDKGKGKTKAKGILSTDGSIKSLKEAKKSFADYTNQLKGFVKTSMNEAKFTKKYDDNPKLKGGQKNLPDALQKGIIQKEDINEELSLEQKKVERFLKAIAKEFGYSIQDAAYFVKDTISKMGLIESVNEIKVDYDFSERELIRVLRQLQRGASTELGMIKAFEKALGRKLTDKELFESVNEATKEEYDALLDKEYELTKVYNKNKTEANWKKLSDIREKGKKLEKELEDQGLLEAQEEDPIDIVTMDVPLFIRVLEYSREDAQEDMDLHDLAQKAIAATKEQGILQMDDYDMLVGDLKQIEMKENMSLDDKAKVYWLEMFKKGKITTLPKNPKEAFLIQMMKDQITHDEETLRHEQGLEEETGYSKYLISKENPKGKTKGLTPKTLNKILMKVTKDLNELKQLGEGVIEEELCEKGKRYIKARQAAGEKSSAYLSGRAVKVCKGQIEWPKKGKKK